MDKPTPLIFMALGILFSIWPLRPIAAQNYNRDIRPILSDRCFSCHGPDEAGNESGVRLDLADEAYDSQAFVPHEVDESSAIERIITDDADIKMPPPESHLAITDAELELLKSWVKNGAEYDQHWAFKPVPLKIKTPAVEASKERGTHAIDAFVSQKLQSHDLQPSPPAEKWRWLRRVTFDLTGLPPTEQEIADFEANDSADAHEQAVDRLLASDRFGQHLAVSWLDIARYADSYGYQSDQLNSNWPYRDWVVKALNENLPYDQFLSWQLAGDMLPNSTRDQTLATTFNRLHRMTNEGGSVELEWRNEYVSDRVNTFGTAMLGLTLECARCHDHKFDPISQKDYYSVSAFFNHIDEWGMYHDGSRVPTPSILLPNAKQQKQIDAAVAKLNDTRSARKRALADFVVSAEQEQEETTGPAASKLESVSVDINRLVVSADEKARSGRLAYWPLDQREKNMLANKVPDGQDAKASQANKLVDGYRGKALKLTGDDAIHFPLKNQWLDPWQPFSISMWIQVPKGLESAILLHRQGGTDVGTFGTRLSLVDSKLRLEITRFWPGNSIAVETTQPLPADKWIHVVMTNQGFGSASSLGLFVDGTSDTEILQDGLYKEPRNRPKERTGFDFGSQFRRVGLNHGLVDEVAYYSFALSPIEARAVYQDSDDVSLESFDRQDVLNHRFVSLQTIAQRSKPITACKQYLTTTLNVTETSVMRENPGESHAYTLNRGDYDAERTEDNIAQRATPSALLEFSDSLPKNRLGLARWLTDRQHPLASRVAVNRFWQVFFGYGLIDTPNDLGYQSTMPVHAELLDWLAGDFVDHGWDVKRLCKQIVLSSTYRQTSAATSESWTRDPKNQLLSRGPAGRLSAESIRDTALFVSGLLNWKSGGPSVSPYQPPNLWKESNSMTPAYRQSVGKNLYRRSLYTVWKRTAPIPNMATFDAPSREVCVVQRSRTNTPQQAMVLLNDIQFVETARVTAEKLSADSSADSDQQKIHWLFRRLAGRMANEKELQILQKLLAEQRDNFLENPDDAKQLIAVGEYRASPTDQPSELAALTVLVQAVFNSDAAIWKR